MPGFDRTGPIGLGPRTGRGMGACGRGSGMGPGRGYCFRRFQTVGLSEEEEKKILQAELQQIEEEKKQIEKKLKETK